VLPLLLPGAGVAAPVRRTVRSPKVVVAIGDSITYGKGASDPDRTGWVALVAAATGCTIDNRGIVGNSLVPPDSSGLIPDRFAHDVLDTDAGVALLGGGRNDLERVGWRRIAREQLQLAALAERAGLRWYVETVTPTVRPEGAAADHSSLGERRRLRLNAFLRRAVPAAHLLDFDRAVSDDTGWLPAAWSADGLHLDDAGNAQLARYVEDRHVCGS
jgi:lysophospholipase L1-like esterase